MVDRARRRGNLGATTHTLRQLDSRDGRCSRRGSEHGCARRAREDQPVHDDGRAACLVAIVQAVRFTGADVLRGELQEFRAIIAVVIGGTLLTGGYGSAVGAVFGALIFGMVRQGIVMTGVDADWFQVFLGATLVVAVIFNDFVRKKATETP